MQGLPFAVWLVPENSTRAMLDAFIASLSQGAGSKPFPAHMTVFSGMTRNERGVKTLVAEEFAGLPPVELDVLGSGQSDHYFRTLFLALEGNDELYFVAEALRATTDPNSEYRLRPHLSLLYGELPEDERRKLLSEFKFDREHLVFTEAWVVMARCEERGWADVDKWDVITKIPLR